MGLVPVGAVLRNRRRVRLKPNRRHVSRDSTSRVARTPVRANIAVCHCREDTDRPGTSAWARKQAERYEASNGADAAGSRGRPIIVMTSIGARTGALRKTALMRVEYDGVYAVVASLGGAAHHPVWYYNLKADPHVEL